MPPAARVGRMAPRHLSERFHPQFRDKNRRDIGTSQSKWDRFQDGNARLTVLPRPGLGVARAWSPRELVEGIWERAVGVLDTKVGGGGVKQLLPIVGVGEEDLGIRSVRDVRHVGRRVGARLLGQLGRCPGERVVSMPVVHRPAHVGVGAALRDVAELLVLLQAHAAVVALGGWDGECVLAGGDVEL
jgi:hypothetical protein